MCETENPWGDLRKSASDGPQYGPVVTAPNVETWR